MNAVVKFPKSKKPAPRRSPRPIASRSVVAQVKAAFAADNRVAAVLGGLIGGSVPFGAYWLAHHELDLSASIWSQFKLYLLLGALLFSAKTVYQWGQSAFQDPWKAAGFVVLTEGIMVASSTPALAAFFLALLMGINFAATAATLANQK
jgi:hypothetical protein